MQPATHLIMRISIPAQYRGRTLIPTRLDRLSGLDRCFPKATQEASLYEFYTSSGQRLYGILQPVMFHKNVVGVVRRHGEYTHARFRQDTADRRKYACQGEAQRAQNLKDPPLSFVQDLTGYQLLQAHDRQLFRSALLLVTSLEPRLTNVTQPSTCPFRCDRVDR